MITCVGHKTKRGEVGSWELLISQNVRLPTPMALVPHSKDWGMSIPSDGNQFTQLLQSVVKNWASYRSMERRNIGMYIAGVMLYRFGLEIFNGSIITLALDRFSPEHTFEKLGALTGINQAMQYVGAILIVCLN